MPAGMRHQRYAGVQTSKREISCRPAFLSRSELWRRSISPPVCHKRNGGPSPADWAEPQQGERDAHPISAQCCLRTPSLLGPLTKRTRKLAKPTLSQNAKPDRSAPATRAGGLSVKLLGPVNDAAAHDPLPCRTRAAPSLLEEPTDLTRVSHAQRARPLRGSSMAQRRPPIGLSRRRAARERLSRPVWIFAFP